jgi:hypothetical protein
MLNYESDCSYETGGVIDFLLNLLNSCIDVAEVLFIVFEMLFDLREEKIELSFYPTQGSLDFIIAHLRRVLIKLGCLTKVRLQREISNGSANGHRDWTHLLLPYRRSRVFCDDLLRAKHEGLLARQTGLNR